MTPDYTDEEKIRAFDALWSNCGNGKGRLLDWVHRSPTTHWPPAFDEATSVRVPRYVFEIIAEGEMRCFKDVLHHLATRTNTPQKDPL